MKRILFVDDEPRILQGLRDLLRKQRRKWDMHFVTGGKEALGALEQAPFDVVIADMRMPGMDGAMLLGEVKRNYPNIARIILSGYAEQEATLRAVPVAHQFLTKPTSAEGLENVIERACCLQDVLFSEAIRARVGEVERLPSLPKVYTELSAVFEDSCSTARDAAAVIERDLAMSAKVLQLANSAFLGCGRKLTNIESAVTYLGFNTVKNLALSLAIFMAWKQPKIESFSLEQLQNHSLRVAKLASTIAGPDKRLAEDAFAAGMLHDVGQLVIALVMPDDMRAMLAEARATARPAYVVEIETWGISHAEIGGYLLGLWGLPFPVVEAVARHHTPGRVAHGSLDVLAIVCVAASLVAEVDGADALAWQTESALDPAYLASADVESRIQGWREAARTQQELSRREG